MHVPLHGYCGVRADIHVLDAQWPVYVRGIEGKCEWSAGSLGNLSDECLCELISDGMQLVVIAAVIIVIIYCFCQLWYYIIIILLLIKIIVVIIIAKLYSSVISHIPFPRILPKIAQRAIAQAPRLLHPMQRHRHA